MLWLAHSLFRLLAALELALFTLGMVALALLPKALIGTLYRHLFHAWCRSFVRALDVDLRLHQHYTGTLPPQYILIANHPSAFEDVGIPALFPVSSLAKAEVRHWWLVGRIANAAGTHFVQREDKESRQSAQKALIAALQSGDNIALYPEGGCKGRRIADRFLYGAFTASLETGLPVVPVFLHYEAQADFEWGPNENLIGKIWTIATARNRCAHYHVFQPFYPNDFRDRDDFSRAVHGQYLEWQARFLD
ncbi:lysophospholipid acyltransferase family protein [Chitinibacteraceae bacterium HSL-7]